MTRRTTTQKGLGWRHQQQRKRLLAQLRDGEPCWWCGLPMYRVQALAADHSKARAHGGQHADRLLHDKCNKARGAGDRDHLRPALTRHTGGHQANALDW
ncbi:Uncharacterised protein [Nocardia farcinica]|uniref:HNH endonuclease n=1 Tax=Nocardia farcinica TaxID=37329 RepID=A0A449G751_NOCFR|nr:hypothetical protein [Nocardia farcinica]VFA94761.1 Uncharacterised protein [Nocardia farcinica]